jgi:hypothetical protein
MKYQEYMKGLNLTSETAFGQCKKICEEMNKVFPELKLIRGHYFCPIWEERGHWWLVNHNNDIIDPTAIQFPSKGEGLYIPWDESQAEPTGKCPNCGELIFDGRYVHKECEIAFISSLYS